MNNPTTIYGVLSGARELLAKPEAWTKGTYARDADGAAIYQESSLATCFCIAGAVRRVAGPNNIILADLVVDTIGDYTTAAFRGLSATAYNDSPTTKHKDVIELLDQVAHVAKLVEV